MKRRSCESFLLLIVAASFLVISGIRPYDRLTWILEVSPFLIAAPLLIATYNRFPLTPLLYRLVLFHALILMLGGHYTYARVPIGTWAQHIFGFARNHYDRLGHLAQGAIPAIASREVLLRCSPLKHGKLLFFLVISVCMGISAFYELAEWWSTLILGQSAEAFLGSQGDVWDTQWDMFLCLLGATAAQLAFVRWYDRALNKLKAETDYHAY